ncbi:MAG: sigma-54 dependent transcriptional regulator [bacterium]|nr:sigma-54 dependent transcriptional regulator [bacterium]
MAQYIRDRMMIGEHHAIHEVQRLARRAARCHLPVLITGETGTGKELLADFIHRNSFRSEGPFVTVDCGVLTREVARSELFGHLRGAFTGALETRQGLVKIAQGGTLFLDEVGELDNELQQYLSRLVQEGEFRPLGGAKMQKANVRLVMATHRDLDQRVSEGAFRKDLFYRLHVISLHLPPLRHRRSDIPLLVAHFLERFQRTGISKREFSDDALRVLEAHDWPGNIRELAHVVAQALVFAEGARIEPKDLSLSVKPSEDVGEIYGLPYKEARQESLNRFTREYLHRTLLKTRGNVSQAARESGIGRQYFQLRMAEQDIRAEPYRRKQ